MYDIKTLEDLAKIADYSFINTLTINPHSIESGEDYNPREVVSGHYVKVKPTPISNPYYIAHSKTLFKELGFSDSFAKTDEFKSMFSADLSNLPQSMSKVGWATGYALSIYGSEYSSQCPFGNGNGYGDGRAISIFEGVLNNKRWEMQLKGSGRTPYCRGADGRAVLRSSIREFLAQEYMYALGVNTSRSLSLFASKYDTVSRAWYTKDSHSFDPDIMEEESVAISTRVASSFLRVGQIELFARRARKNEHKNAKKELEEIVLYTIKREYKDEIDNNLSLEEKILLLAKKFQERLILLVVNWIRVGYTQGNFNSDNCALGGFTLDFGPFGFIELFDPSYQPWTGGGRHFSFFNQPNAAFKNYNSFCKSLRVLLDSNDDASLQLNNIINDFSNNMNKEIDKMWASKLGINKLDDDLFNELMELMVDTSVDYTIFFRELSNIPDDVTQLKKSFYKDITLFTDLENRWNIWLINWKKFININNKDGLSKKMKLVNPKYTLREWHLVEAYTKAKIGDYSIIHELQEVINKPYDEQSKTIENKYYSLRPNEFFNIGGISHISCSS